VSTASGALRVTLAALDRPRVPLERYLHPDEFERLGALGYELGFSHVASGPMVRSSYHADRQAQDVVG
jgi:lipoic acid synthetase